MKTIILILFLGLITSCANHGMVTSTTNLAEDNNGILYYLPKKLHKVTVKRELITKEKLEKKVKANIAAQIGAEKEKTKNEKEYKKLKAIADNTPPGKAKEKAQEKADLANGTHLTSKNILKTLTNNVDSSIKALANLKTVGATECNYKVDFKIEPLGLFPDTGYPFWANLNHEIFRSDEFTIETTEKGLLNSIDAVGKDESAEILKVFANSIGLLLGDVVGVQDSTKIFSLSAAVPKASQAEIKCELEDKSFSQIIDLSDSLQINALNRSLDPILGKTVGYNIAIDVVGYTQTEIIPSSSCIEESKDVNCKTHIGLFYRRSLPYVVNLIKYKDKIGENFEYDAKKFKVTENVSTALIEMPNASPISYVSFDTGAFVTTKHNYSFKEGMLLTGKIDKPSEALAFAKLPIDIAKGMLSVLTEVIQLKVNYSSGQTSLLNQQKELIEAIRLLKEAENTN